MATFLLLYRPGPAWITGKPVTEQPPPQHGHYLLRLFADGYAAFSRSLDRWIRVPLIVPDVPTMDEAQAIAAADPAVRDGVFVYECRPWQLISWDQYPIGGAATQDW